MPSSCSHSSVLFCCRNRTPSRMCCRSSGDVDAVRRALDSAASDLTLGDVGAYDDPARDAAVPDPAPAASPAAAAARLSNDADAERGALRAAVGGSAAPPSEAVVKPGEEARVWERREEVR